MVVIDIPNNVQMNGTVKELMLHVMTLMNQNIVTWNVMLDVVRVISVMAQRVGYSLQPRYGWRWRYWFLLLFTSYTEMINIKFCKYLLVKTFRQRCIILSFLIQLNIYIVQFGM